jgi:DeoR/GlpR family transcriptional regulator of sugar metabolism
VSEDTIRRDLRELAAQGLVQRVHGGALAPAPQPGTFAHRAETCGAEKAALARAAVELLAHARVILLDGSTTNLELARRLPADGPRTVLTNSPPIAAALAEHPTADVVMIGGRLDKGAQVTTGATAVDFIRAVRADACVLGVCALHHEAGLSTDDLDEAQVKRAMVDAAADVIVLATVDKLSAGSPYLVAPVAELTHLVVEAGTPDELIGPYRELGVSVTRA